jgi:hypothetical protein
MLVSPVFASLPRAIDCKSQAEAQNLSYAYVTALGAQVMTKQGATTSMSPLVGAHAIFLYVRDFKAIERGSVVIRRDPDMNVCHEVIAKVGDEWEMKGKTNRAPDRNRLTEANYLGTVVMILNYP